MPPHNSTMSRNIKIKNSAGASRTAPKRRLSDSSTPNLSDSDGYSELDEVPESDDDDEEDVKAAEEQHLITSALRKAKPRSPRPHDESDDEIEEEDDDDEEDEEDAIDDSDLTPDDAEDADAEEDDEEADDNASWNGFLTDQEEPEHASPSANHAKTPNTAERRVRFADDVPIPSSDTSTDTDSDNGAMFPDLLEEAYCSPALLREIHRNQHEVDLSSNDSYWDFASMGYDPSLDAEAMQLLDPLGTLLSGTEDETSGTTPRATQENTIGLGSPFEGHLDLDSDDSGDSTDTDDEAPLMLQKMKNAERAAGDTTGAESTDSDEQSKMHDTPVVQHMTKHIGRPRSGKVKIDENGPRAIVVFDRKKKRLVTLTAQVVQAMDEKEAKGGNDNPFFELPDLPELNLADINMNLLSSPAPNVMLSSMNMFPDLFSSPGVGQTGPAEAFFSSFDASAFPDMDLSSDEFQDSLDEAEMDLQLDDFLAFGDDDFTDAETPGAFTQDPSTPTRPTTAGSELDTPLGHLQNNSNAVGAFRRNQINQSLILSDKATEDSLAFSGPYHQGAIRGIKNGRLDGASVSISPVRRQKGASFDTPKTPLAGQKRGAQSEPDQAHKKQRSISEVGDMRI